MNCTNTLQLNQWYDTWHGCSSLRSATETQMCILYQACILFVFCPLFSSPLVCVASILQYLRTLPVKMRTNVGQWEERNCDVNSNSASSSTDSHSGSINCMRFIHFEWNDGQMQKRKPNKSGKLWQMLQCSLKIKYDWNKKKRE